LPIVRCLLPACLLFLVYEVQPVITAVYFWTYMVVAYFIIFNMILAVIFNVYNKKTEALEEKEKVTTLGNFNSLKDHNIDEEDDECTTIEESRKMK
jgi:hypothetical protein